MSKTPRDMTAAPLCDIIIERDGSAYTFRAETDAGQIWVDTYAPGGTVAPDDFGGVLHKAIASRLAVIMKG
jgi:hypothetical protein